MVVVSLDHSGNPTDKGSFPPPIICQTSHGLHSIRFDIGFVAYIPNKSGYVQNDFVRRWRDDAEVPVVLSRANLQPIKVTKSVERRVGWIVTGTDSIEVIFSW